MDVLYKPLKLCFQTGIEKSSMDIWTVYSEICELYKKQFCRSLLWKTVLFVHKK